MSLLRRPPGARPEAERILARLSGDGPGVAVPAATSESFSRARPFIGREAELAALLGHFERIADEGARIVCITGDTGVGKSALAARLASRITRDHPNAVVLTGRTHERESVPFNALDGLVDALSEHLSKEPEVAGLLSDDAPLVAQQFPVLGRVEAIVGMQAARGEVVFRGDLRPRAFAALRELLSRLAARAPLVLIVDDFHWADADSLALVADLMHRSDAPGLLFVWVVRTKPGDPLPLRLEELREQLGVVHVLDVNPLPEHDAMALASVLYERASGAKLTDARRVAEEARGNPLLIEELVRHVATAQEHSVDAARLDHALLERVGALEDGARRVVHVVATAGVPVRIAAVARTAGIALDSCARTVEDLCARNLLRLDGFGGRRDVSPYHERVREVVLRAMPDDVRTATHRAIARSLMSDDASDLDPQVVIRHLIMAGDLESAAAHAQRAADRAAEAFAFDRAAELYRVALRLAEGGDESEGQIKRSLALALSMAGRGPDAADVYLSIAETAEPDTGRECRRLASEQLLLTGHIGRGLRVLSTVLADFGIRLPSSPRRSLASLLWNRAKLRLRGMRFELRDATAIPPEDLSRLDVLYAVGSSMAMVDNICGADYQSRALLLALELGDRYRIVRSLATEAMLLGSQGKEAAANSLLQRGWQLVADDRDSSLLAYMTAARGTNHHFCGRFRPAIIDFDDAEELWMSGVAGSEFELAVVRIFRMYALRFVGDCHELRRQFDLHVREARRRNDRYVETTFTRAFNMVWLADDDPGQAREDLASSGWTPPKAGYHIQHWFKLRARAELALYVGDAASTREKQHTGFLRLKSSMLLRIKVIRSDVFWLTGRLALAEVMAGADPKPCQDHALAMARKLRAERIKYATAWAYMLRAAVHAQRGDHATSIRDLNEAADYAKRGELELTTAAIRRRRGQLIGGHDGAMIVAASDEWMRNHGVRNPARMTAMLLPGFDETLQM